jgi:hypothetical protein
MPRHHWFRTAVGVAAIGVGRLVDAVALSLKSMAQAQQTIVQEKVYAKSVVTST